MVSTARLDSSQLPRYSPLPRVTTNYANYAIHLASSECQGGTNSDFPRPFLTAYAVTTSYHNWFLWNFIQYACACTSLSAWSGYAICQWLSCVCSFLSSSFFLSYLGLNVFINLQFHRNCLVCVRAFVCVEWLLSTLSAYLVFLTSLSHVTHVLVLISDVLNSNSVFFLQMYEKTNGRDSGRGSVQTCSDISLEQVTDVRKA